MTSPTSESIERPSSRLLQVELLLVFVALPIGLYFVRRAFSRLIIPTLLILAVLCLIALWRDPAFERRRLGLGDWRAGWMRILKTFVPGALLISAAVYVLRPELWLAFPKRDPFWWMVVMLAYPLLSVYPQELLFRTFFFHRYRSILPTELQRVLWSALVFGLAHLFFANWIAPTMTAVGGYLFARTYARSESTVMASIEHALWGDFLFTVGLGFYFWGGSIRLMAEAAGG